MPQSEQHPDSTPLARKLDFKKQLSIDTHMEIKPWTPNLPRFDPTTTNREFYKQHNIAASRHNSATAHAHANTPQPVKHNLKFEASSSYKDDYKWDAHDAAGALPPSSLTAQSSPKYVPNPAKFCGETSYRSDYKKWAPQTTPKISAESHAPTYTPVKLPLQSETTSRADFKKWPTQPRPSTEVHSPPGYHPSDIPFEGETTTRSDFKVWPMEVSPSPSVVQRPVYVPSMASFDATTTSRADFKILPLPAHVPHSVGVQIVAGQFFELIPRGARAPARGQAIFTTCEDDQASVSIKVLASDGNGAASTLGSFELAGIEPAKAGSPQITVTLSMPEASTLHVAAYDRLGNAGVRHLEIIDQA